jgi:hypothetical protein
MTSVIMERYITTNKDMDDIERAIAAELGGENGRCAFLRSQSYQLLRMAAVYRTNPAKYTAYHGSLAVTLESTGLGSRVTVRNIDLFEYQDGPDLALSCQEQRMRDQRLSAL